MEAAVFVRDKATLTTVMQFIRGKFVYLISTEFRVPNFAILTGQYFALTGNYEKRALKFAIEVFSTSFRVGGCQLNQ